MPTTLQEAREEIVKVATNTIPSTCRVPGAPEFGPSSSPPAGTFHWHATRASNGRTSHPLLCSRCGEPAIDCYCLAPVIDPWEGGE